MISKTGIGIGAGIGISALTALYNFGKIGEISEVCEEAFTCVAKAVTGEGCLFSFEAASEGLIWVYYKWEYI